MRVRVLHVIESTPGFPLLPGRTIEAAKLTPEMRGWLESGRAEILRDEPEAAVVTDGESAALPEPDRRGRRGAHS